MVLLADSIFDSRAHWINPITKSFQPQASDLDLFDQNGYDLTVLEQHFAEANDIRPLSHREHRMAIKQPWFTQESKIEGSVLNHSLIFERKSYSGAALAQLQEYAKDLPLIYKVISMRAKWGLDFSMDYVDREGNAFEVLHWEWDSFDYEEICHAKEMIEPILLAIDWEDAAQNILKHKEEWHHLDFFGQSDWKCNFFGVPKERFKMVAWA